MSSTPIGQTSSENTSPEGLGESQEAERGIVMTPLPKLTFAQEKLQLQQEGNWLTQNDLVYLQVSFYLNEPNNIDSIKCQYSFRTRGRYDLKANKFSAKFTRNRFDYIRNVRERWADIDDQAPIYQKIFSAIDQGLKEDQLVFGAKSRPTRTFKKNQPPGDNPIMPMGTSVLFKDEGVWNFHLWHHDFYVELQYDGKLWDQDLARWRNQYAIAIEGPRATRPRDVPPFVKLYWGKE